MSDKPLELIPGAGKIDAMAAALRTMKANVELLIEYNAIDARVTRARFDALVKEGFTPDQALALCKRSA